jgi:hypothetical protein
MLVVAPPEQETLHCRPDGQGTAPLSPPLLEEPPPSPPKEAPLLLPLPPLLLPLAPLLPLALPLPLLLPLPPSSPFPPLLLAPPLSELPHAKNNVRTAVGIATILISRRMRTSRAASRKPTS